MAKASRSFLLAEDKKICYTYNAENTRIRNLCSDSDTTYTCNTNCRLSQLLTKIENGITTKYVYGLGLIGEENCEQFKTYHFDYRGSTVAITDECGNITDTFEYDVYGNQTVHYGNSVVIFGYNGRDGVVTDNNGLIYMRARYYSPALRRFVNADILHGDIFDPATLNRYAYVNGNPVSFVDPMGMSKDEERGSIPFYRGLSNNYKIPEYANKDPRSVIIQKNHKIVSVNSLPKASFEGEESFFEFAVAETVRLGKMFKAVIDSFILEVDLGYGIAIGGELGTVGIDVGAKHKVLVITVEKDGITHDTNVQDIYATADLGVFEFGPHLTYYEDGKAPQETIYREDDITIVSADLYVYVGGVGFDFSFKQDEFFERVREIYAK